MNLKTKVVAAVLGSTILGGGITSVVQHNEGYSSTAYKDPVGVWTICYGETKGVKRGMKLTMTECNTQLRISIAYHASALNGLPEDLPDTVVLGSIDMIYNTGVGAFNSSTAKRMLVLGKYKEAADAVLLWRYITLPDGTKYDCSSTVKGKPNTVCWGLWKRRQWQSAAIGNQFKTVQEAVQALTR